MWISGHGKTLAEAIIRGNNRRLRVLRGIRHESHDLTGMSYVLLSAKGVIHDRFADRIGRAASQFEARWRETRSELVQCVLHTVL